MKNLFVLICLSIFLALYGSTDSEAQNADEKANKIRLGITAVKTTNVGEGIDARQFGEAIQNSLTEYLKSPNVDLVVIEAKLPSAIESETKVKAIDYLISATVSHKKGSGGFGKMFGTVAPVLGQVAPIAGMGGNVAGAIAGQVAATAVMTVASMSQNVKAKDAVELSVSIHKASDKSNILTKQFKAKAKSDGEDIITPLIEQAAQSIIDTASGKTSVSGVEKK